VEQHHAAGGLGIMNQLFEATSAFCTVGVSSGVTAASGMLSRILIICLMFIGRVGLLTVAMSLVEGGVKETVLHYPTEDILIG
jgi:trk system potassium uptake protein TrkH